MTLFHDIQIFRDAPVDSLIQHLINKKHVNTVICNPQIDQQLNAEGSNDFSKTDFHWSGSEIE